MILDDSLSSVDTETEYLIQQALEQLMHGRTTFVIAQRLSTVKNADQIVILDGGRIVERGTTTRYWLKTVFIVRYTSCSFANRIKRLQAQNSSGQKGVMGSAWRSR